MLEGAKVSEIMDVAMKYATSSEPISAVVLWLGANLGIEKKIYISLLNVLLVVGLFVLARKHRVSMLMTGLLLSNYYLVVLMSGAERLKIAYIVLIFAMLAAGKLRIFLLVLSPLAHLQSIILLAGAWLASFERDVKNLICHLTISKKSLIVLIVMLIMVTVLGAFLLEGILIKVAFYFSLEVPPEDLIKLFILIVVAVYVSQKRLRMSLGLFPMIPAVMLLGGMRVNMIAVTLVIYYLMEERRLHHPLMYILMVYYSIKTIPFVYKTVLYGHGFA
jgi:hypothetical protein